MKRKSHSDEEEYSNSDSEICSSEIEESSWSHSRSSSVNTNIKTRSENSKIAVSKLGSDALEALRRLTNNFRMTMKEINKCKELKEPPLNTYERSDIKHVIRVERQKIQ